MNAILISAGGQGQRLTQKEVKNGVAYKQLFLCPYAHWNHETGVKIGEETAVYHSCLGHYSNDGRPAS